MQGETKKSYGRYYAWQDDYGTGFSFPCDEQGNIFEDQLDPISLNTLKQIQSGKLQLIDHGVLVYTNVN